MTTDVHGLTVVEERGKTARKRLWSVVAHTLLIGASILPAVLIALGIPLLRKSVLERRS